MIDREMIFLNTKHRLFYFLSGIIQIIIGIFLLYISIKFTIYILPIPIQTFLILLPFMICIFCSFLSPLANGISIIIKFLLEYNNNKLFFIEGKLYQIAKFPTFLKIIYLASFCFYWFMMIFIGTYTTIRDGNYAFLLFILPFFVIGIIMLRMILKNWKH